MGELADRIGAVIDTYASSIDGNLASELELIAKAVAEIEKRNDVESPLDFDGLPDFDPSRLPLPPDYHDRLAAAEKRAEAFEDERNQAWRALAELVQCDASIVDVDPVPSHINEIEIRGRGATTNWESLLATPAHRGTRLAILVQQHPPNPDLLERRGTELIEAGEKLLAEYQRQRAADEKVRRDADERENAAFRATPKDPDADVVTMTMRMWPGEIER